MAGQRGKEENPPTGHEHLKPTTTVPSCRFATLKSNLFLRIQHVHRLGDICAVLIGGLLAVLSHDLG